AAEAPNATLPRLAPTRSEVLDQHRVAAEARRPVVCSLRPQPALAEVLGRRPVAAEARQQVICSLRWKAVRRCSRQTEVAVPCRAAVVEASARRQAAERLAIPPAEPEAAACRRS